jgi:purine-binding chemotaxis protein CheW
MSTVIEEQIQRPAFGQAASEKPLDGLGEQYLTFFLDEEEYGVDILRVQEIKGWDKVTPLPNSSDFVQGVINLRGFVVPIIDLRRRFGKQPVPPSKTTVVIVLKVHGHKAERIMGFVVDAVSDVYTVAAEQLRPPPDLGSSQTMFLKGLATVDSKMVILLDVDQLADAGA